VGGQHLQQQQDPGPSPRSWCGCWDAEVCVCSSCIMHATAASHVSAPVRLGTRVGGLGVSAWCGLGVPQRTDAATHAWIHCAHAAAWLTSVLLLLVLLCLEGRFARCRFAWCRSGASRTSKRTSEVVFSDSKSGHLVGKVHDRKPLNIRQIHNNAPG
jgi:hypothetical protein